MKMRIEILPRKTILHVEGGIEQLKKITPSIIFAAKKERENLKEMRRMDSLFKDYCDENGIPF